MDEDVRVQWNKYDVIMPDKICIEVKTSGYLQSWEQTTLSKIKFGIAPTFGWDKETNTYDSICKRQSDIYIFCVHNCKDKAKVNPLDISQWDFYIMSTANIEKSFKNQKSVTLSRLIRNGAEKCSFYELQTVVSRISKENIR